MVDGQVAHTPTSYHKDYHPTMPLNFFVTSLVTSSPTLCTCLYTITSMTSVISPTTYLYYCHHSHQHQLILLPNHVFDFLRDFPGDISMEKS